MTDNYSRKLEADIANWLSKVRYGINRIHFNASLNIPVNQKYLINNSPHVHDWESITGKPLLTSFYFHNDVDPDIAGYEQLLDIPGSGTESIETADTNSILGQVLIDSYISQPSAGMNILLIQPGTWTFNLYGKVDTVVGTTLLTVKVYKRASGGTETLLFTASTNALTATVALHTIETAQVSFAVDLTDRLVIKVYCESTSVPTRTVSWYYEGTTHASYVVPPDVLSQDLSNVHGPASAVDGNVVLFDGTSGVLVKDSGYSITGINADQVDSRHAGNASGNVAVNNGTLNTDLNADKLDGLHADAAATADAHIPATNSSGTVNVVNQVSTKELTSSDGTGAHFYAKTPSANDVNAFAEIAMGGRRSNVSHPIFLIRSKYNNNGAWANRSLYVVAQDYAGATQSTIFTLRETGAMVLGGTSFPSSPTTGDVFYRSDLGMFWYYTSGIGWLTLHEYCIEANDAGYAYSSNAVQSIGVYHALYDPYVTRIEFRFNLASPQDGTRYWTVTPRHINAAYSSATYICQFTTNGFTTGANIAYAPTISTPTNSSNKYWMDVDYSKTGAAGNINNVSLAVFYRLFIA